MKLLGWWSVVLSPMLFGCVVHDGPAYPPAPPPRYAAPSPASYAAPPPPMYAPPQAPATYAATPPPPPPATPPPVSGSAAPAAQADGMLMIDQLPPDEPAPTVEVFY